MRQSVSKMKIVIALFVVVACSGVWGSKPPLDKSWDSGANKVSAPITELLVSGATLKKEFIAAIDQYLSTLDLAIDRQLAFKALDFSKTFGQLVLDIKGKVVLANQGFAGPTEFDYELIHLAEKIDEIVAIVRKGEKSLSQRQNVSKGIESLMEKLRRIYLQNASQKLAKASTRYTMDQLFFNFQKAVLERDLDILEKWQTDTFKSGYDSVQVDSVAMEKKHRLENLWTNVQQLQKDVNELAAFDSIIQEFSTASVWTNYKRARADLLAIDVATKIQEDEA